MGERFLPWQLEQTLEESWAECERHARNILGESGFKKLQADIARQNEPEPEPFVIKESANEYFNLPMDASANAVAGETDLFGIPVQKDLFGNVVDGKGKRKK